ncbi:MAG TPA: hypothetical protein DEB46_03405 [Myxococcales bacterium]|nr:hypothetical protein [Myxococcales bacterium]
MLPHQLRTGININRSNGVIVCLCHGVSDRQINKLLVSGEASTVAAVQDQTRCGTDCGTCIAQLRAIVDAAELRRWNYQPPVPRVLRHA